MLSRYGTDENGELIKKAIVYTKSEHFISKDKIDPDALQIIHRLHDLGFIAYIVGGAVRDSIIGNTPKDFDIVTFGYQFFDSIYTYNGGQELPFKINVKTFL